MKTKCGNRNKWVTLGLLVGVLVATCSGANPYVIINWVDPHGTDGEFTMTATGGQLNGATFKTFCIETSEYIGYPTCGPYNYTITDAASGQGTDKSDPLSIGAAWLYSQFRAGTLADYYNTDPTTYILNQNTLQAAFWWLEDETQPSGFPYDLSNINGNKFLIAANNALHFYTSGTLLKLKDDAGANNYGVKVLHLTTLDGGRAQDQLCYVPDGGVTMALFGFAILGLSAVGRRFSKS
jgi:hypothetical protein